MKKDMDKILIMKRFLRKLINLNMWQHKHTEEKNLVKAISKHLRGQRVTKEAIKELVKLGFIHYKISTGELHVSLNSKKKKEIYSFLKQKVI